MDLSLEIFVKWKQQYEEFRMAIRAGRDEADAKVARALFRRAVGWGTLEEEVISRKIKDKDGNERIETKVVPKRKRYPPDVQAIAMWLRNRHPDKWRINDGVQVTPVQINMDLSTLSLDDLRIAQRLGISTQQNNKELAAFVETHNNGHKVVNE